MNPTERLAVRRSQRVPLQAVVIIQTILPDGRPILPPKIGLWRRPTQATIIEGQREAGTVRLWRSIVRGSVIWSVVTYCGV